LSRAILDERGAVPDIKPWRELRRRRLLDCSVFSVDASLARSPLDGSEHEFYRITSRDWVQIVPMTADNEVVMVWQYRHGAGSLSLEVPAGLIDPGEQPAAAARRECLEETGYEASDITRLGSVNPNSAYFTNRLHMFYALGAERVGEIQNSASEQTEVELVPLRSVEDLILDGTIDHALNVGLLWRVLREIGG
jgi:ADP-ribose pyrophosphatase